MPQEIEVWYLLPALRRELAKVFISDYDMSQKQVSQILMITESAISQYLKSKRGNELKFNDSEILKIKEAAKVIASKSGDSNEEIYKLCLKFRGCDSLCDLHRKQDCTIADNCDLCVGIEN